jgi:hypothetical protein
MKYIVNVFLLLFICVPGSDLFAFGNMSADEVRTLFTAKTAEGEQRDGIAPGHGPENMTENFPEKFVIFFAANGTVKHKIGDKGKTGTWHVTDSGKLCLKWKGKKKRCAPVYKDGKVYKRVTESRMGRVLLELVFFRFTPGNKYDL